jgi:hypothetical protein
VKKFNIILISVALILGVSSVQANDKESLKTVEVDVGKLLNQVLITGQRARQAEDRLKAIRLRRKEGKGSQNGLKIDAENQKIKQAEFNAQATRNLARQAKKEYVKGVAQFDEDVKRADKIFKYWHSNRTP